jgi:DNA-directed RNA polymerase specialized sigma24 family protein
MRGAPRPTSPDLCWLAGIRARDPDALERLYNRYRAPVMHFLSLVEPDRASAEACLDVFEEVWHGAVANPPDGAIAEWILRLAYRVLQRRAETSSTAQDLPPPQGAPRRMLSALSLEQRVVVALVYANKLSIDSIETVTGMTHDEITGHLSRACDFLRRQSRELAPTP